MSWGAVAIEGDLNGCGNCPPVFGVGTTCEGQVTVDVTQENDQIFPGEHAAGSYIVALCKGAFNYGWENGGGWVITKWSGGTFITIVAGTDTHGFSDAMPPGVGYETEAEAIAAGRCRSIRFLHSGGGIKAHFGDVFYEDNVLGVAGAPTFALYRVVPLIRYNCTTTAYMLPLDNPVQINPTLVLQNITDGQHDITFAIQTTGGVTWAEAPKTITFLPLQEQQVGFVYHVAANNSNHVLTINMSNGGYDTIAPYVIDMSPLIYTEWELGVDWGNGWHLCFLNWQNNGNGPSTNVQFKIYPQGGTQVADLDEVPVNPYTYTEDVLGVYRPLCSGNLYPGASQVQFLVKKDPDTNSARLTATISDPCQTYPAPEPVTFTW